MATPRLVRLVAALRAKSSASLWSGLLGAALSGKRDRLGAGLASIGFGVQQAMQMLGGQSVGFISGEWRGVPRGRRGPPRGRTGGERFFSWYERQVPNLDVDGGAIGRAGLEGGGGHRLSDPKRVTDQAASEK